MRERSRAADRARHAGSRAARVVRSVVSLDVSWPDATVAHRRRAGLSRPRRPGGAHRPEQARACRPSRTPLPSAGGHCVVVALALMRSPLRRVGRKPDTAIMEIGVLARLVLKGRCGHASRGAWRRAAIPAIVPVISLTAAIATQAPLATAAVPADSAAEGLARIAQTAAERSRGPTRDFAGLSRSSIRGGPFQISVSPGQGTAYVSAVGPTPIGCQARTCAGFVLTVTATDGDTFASAKTRVALYTAPAGRSRVQSRLATQGRSASDQRFRPRGQRSASHWPARARKETPRRRATGAVPSQRRRGSHGVSFAGSSLDMVAWSNVGLRPWVSKRIPTASVQLCSVGSSTTAGEAGMRRGLRSGSSTLVAARAFVGAMLLLLAALALVPAPAGAVPPVSVSETVWVPLACSYAGGSVQAGLAVTATVPGRWLRGVRLAWRGSRRCWRFRRRRRTCLAGLRGPRVSSRGL